MIFSKGSIIIVCPMMLLSTVQILCIGTDRSQQTVQTKIRLLLQKQSDQGLHCFAIPSASFGCINAMLHQTFLFLGQLWQLFWGVPNFRIFTVFKMLYMYCRFN